jgi:hypothetical protein
MIDNTYAKIIPMFPNYEYRSAFMTEIFELVYHGGGGFSWSEVWNMPVTTRRFNLMKIKEYLKKVEELREQNNQKVTENTDMKKFKVPDHVKQASKDYDFVSKVKSKK